MPFFIKPAEEKVKMSIDTEKRYAVSKMSLLHISGFFLDQNHPEPNIKFLKIIQPMNGVVDITSKKKNSTFILSKLIY